MADTDMRQTVFIPSEDLPDMDDTYGTVGVVVYMKSFNPNGVCVWIVPEARS